MRGHWLLVIDCIWALASQVRWKIDAALEDHWNSKPNESRHYWRYDTIAELNIEDGGRNDFPLQQFKCRYRASDRPYDSTSGLFNRRLEFKRDERLILDN